EGAHVREELLGVDTRIVNRKKTEPRELGAHASRVVLQAAPDRRLLVLQPLGRDALGHPEVHERDAAIVQQLVVARMRVARELPVAVERAEEEAKDALTEAVAGGTVEPLDVLELHAIDPFADEHALTRELAEHLRDDDERVAAVSPRERPLR